jgi:hypothetical protein
MFDSVIHTQGYKYYMLIRMHSHYSSDQLHYCINCKHPIQDFYSSLEGMLIGNGYCINMELMMLYYNLYNSMANSNMLDMMNRMRHMSHFVEPED